MWYLIGFGLAMALAPLPLRVSAQTDEGDATAGSSPVELVPSSESVTEEPAREMSADEPALGSEHKPWLELEIDWYGLKMKRTGPTVGGADYILVREGPRRGVRAARAGLIASCGVLAAGGALLAGAFIYTAPDSGGFDDLNIGGNIGMAAVAFLFTVGGVVGVGISGHRLRSAKREERLKGSDEPHVRGVQFDPHNSRFVF